MTEDARDDAAGRRFPPSSPPPSGPPPPAGPPPAGDGRITAIAGMTLAGGIWALLVALGLVGYGLIAGIATFGLGCLILLPAAYSLVLGILATLKGARLLGSNPQAESPPKDIAILQIINVVSCDFVNVVLGILTLVFLNDPAVSSFYRGR